MKYTLNPIILEIKKKTFAINGLRETNRLFTCAQDFYLKKTLNDNLL